MLRKLTFAISCTMLARIVDNDRTIDNIFTCQSFLFSLRDQQGRYGVIASGKLGGQMISTGCCYRRLVHGYDCAVGVSHQSCVEGAELVGANMSLAKANNG